MGASLQSMFSFIALGSLGKYLWQTLSPSHVVSTAPTRTNACHACVDTAAHNGATQMPEKALAANLSKQEDRGAAKTGSASRPNRPPALSQKRRQCMRPSV